MIRITSCITKYNYFIVCYDIWYVNYYCYNMYIISCVTIHAIYIIYIWFVLEYAHTVTHHYFCNVLWYSMCIWSVLEHSHTVAHYHSCNVLCCFMHILSIIHIIHYNTLCAYHLSSSASHAVRQIARLRSQSVLTYAHTIAHMICARICTYCCTSLFI